MARYDSFVKFKGTLGGLTFYEDLLGGGLVKQKNRSYQPTSEGTKRNNRELGGASTMCKHFRHSFLTVAKQFSDQGTQGRLNGHFRNVIAMGTGNWGERVFDLKAHPELVIGFQFQGALSLGQVLAISLLQPELNETRDMVRWHVPSFKPSKQVNAPIEATHFQLVLVATQVSQGVYDADQRLYVQVQPAEAHSAGVAYSAAFELTTATIDAFELPAVPGRHLPTPDGMTVVVCVGIVFSKEVNGVLEILKDGKAMEIVGVG